MWLVTAVGPVNGQRHFTFALEQNHSYTVGRDKAADIKFESRTVRPKEGVLEVGQWDPSNPRIAPRLVWKSEPKKNGSFYPLKLLTQNGESASTDKDEYTVEDREGVQEHELEAGKGVELNSDAWFTLQWRPFQFCYDRVKDESEELTSVFERYCVGWTTSFEINNIPDVLILAAYKNTVDPNYAVCYGVPMVTPDWLSMLSYRLKGCWKKAADSENSFIVPPTDNEDCRPKLPDDIPKNRKEPAQWRTDPSNRTLFAEYRILGLTSKKAINEKRYFIAMGADWVEMDLSRNSVQSREDFLQRLQPLIADAEAAGRTLVPVYYPTTKAIFAERGLSFEEIVLGASKDAGLDAAGVALVLWGAVARGGVQAYFDFVNGQREEKSQLPTPKAAEPATAPEPESSQAEPTQVEPPRPAGRLPRRATSRPSSRAASRAPSPGPASTAPQLDRVPSTYPDDTMAATKPAETASSSASGPKKPLRRRAGRDTGKLDIDDDMDMQDTQAGTQYQSHIPETQLSSGSQSLGSRIPDSMDVDMPAPSLPARTARSKLKRRAAGAPTQSTFLDGFDITVMDEEARLKKEAESEIRKLYEEVRGETQPVEPRSKRQRTAGPSDSREETPAIAMEVDEDDFVSRALRTARTKREPVTPAKPLPSPPKSRSKTPAPIREESEEVEERVEVPKKKKTTKKGDKDNSPDKDEGFLQAVKTSRAKKALDELDLEFNQLRILKPSKTRAKASEVVAAKEGAAAPQPLDYDYKLLDDRDDLTGNFIEVVRKDLLRKDVPKVGVIADDGRPNYKKFKKKNIVRRTPVGLQLNTHSHAADMGEPYWQAEDFATQRKSQKQSQSFDDEDEAPLLPTARGGRRRLLPVDEDDEPLLPPSKRRGATPAATQNDSQQTQLPFTAVPKRSRAGTARTTRAAREDSVASEASSIAPTARKRKTLRETPDSEDEAPFATARTGSARSMRATRGTTAVMPATSEVAPSASIAPTGRSTRASAIGTATARSRRRLLVDDDDDDEITFMGVQKKRRVG